MAKNSHQSWEEDAAKSALKGAAHEIQRDRFVQALNQALVANKFSQRELCVELGITIGTLTKYLRGDVDPNKVGVAIMRKLAKQLGFTTNTLLDYFDTGEYRSELTIDDVASWIQSEAGQSDLPQLFSALQKNSESAMRSVPPAVVKWEGYSDEEARIWCENMHETVKYLSTKLGKSIRAAWVDVEEILTKECKLINDEIDQVWEIAVGGRIGTGRELTEARAHYHGRFEEPCPLTVALKTFKELEDFKPLSICSSICAEVKAGELAA